MTNIEITTASLIAAATEAAAKNATEAEIAAAALRMAAKALPEEAKNLEACAIEFDRIEGEDDEEAPQINLVCGFTGAVEAATAEDILDYALDGGLSAENVFGVDDDELTKEVSSLLENTRMEDFDWATWSDFDCSFDARLGNHQLFVDSVPYVELDAGAEYRETMAEAYNAELAGAVERWAETNIDDDNEEKARELLGVCERLLENTDGKGHFSTIESARDDLKEFLEGGEDEE